MNQTSSVTAVDWLVGTFKRNPEGLLLLGAGAVLLMRPGGGSRISSTAAHRVRAENAGGSGNGVTHLAEGLVRGVNEMTSTATDYAKTATDYAKQATDSVSESSSRAAQQVQTTVQTAFARVLEEQPLAIALAGLATGAAIASVLPTSDFEKETVGPISNQASQAALEKIKGAVATVGDTLKSAANERGLNVEGLKEVASEVVDAVTSGESADIGGQSADAASAQARPA